VSLGLVPLGGVGPQLLDAGEVLPHGTPEARFGLSVGLIVGGIATTAGGVAGGLLGGATTATGAGAPVGVPVMVVSTTLVVGGALNVAAGIRGLTQSLSTGGDSGSVSANRYVNPKALRPTHRPDSNAKIDKYAKSMRKDGYDPSEPIEAVEIDGALYITNGHHRAAAAAKAGIREVPVIVRPPRSPEHAAEIIRNAISTLDDRF
jgi:hypothetical protein